MKQMCRKSLLESTFQGTIIVSNSHASIPLPGKVMRWLSLASILDHEKELSIDGTSQEQPRSEATWELPRNSLFKFTLLALGNAGGFLSVPSRF